MGRNFTTAGAGVAATRGVQVSEGAPPSISKLRSGTFAMGGRIVEPMKIEPRSARTGADGQSISGNATWQYGVWASQGAATSAVSIPDTLVQPSAYGRASKGGIGAADQSAVDAGRGKGSVRSFQAADEKGCHAEAGVWSSDKPNGVAEA